MNAPLVSVVVVTYNSSKTIIDTLDSIYYQTYQNVELIVSDDGSEDCTTNLCDEWLNSHKERFYGTKLLSHSINRGIVRNLNSGVKASSGVWIKSIAGDDLMIPGALQRYVDFCNSNRQCHMCISDVEPFSDEGEVDSSVITAYSGFYKLSETSQEEQWKGIQKGLCFVGPSYFYSRTLYEEVGGFDESYVLGEEWPFCYEILKRGYRIFPIPEKLIRYRVSLTSVCRSSVFEMANKLLFKDTRRFFYKKLLPQLLSDGEIYYAYEKLLYYEKMNLRYKHGVGSRILIFLIDSISPSCWVSFFKELR